MDAVSGEAKRRNQLPDLDSLDVASLKALVLAKHTEIENLNLLVLKLKRMHFGQRSEKMNATSGNSNSGSKTSKRIRPQPNRFPRNWRSSP